MHGTSLSDPPGCGLEQDAHPRLVRHRGLTVYAEPGPQRTSPHRTPGWKLVVGRTASVEVDSPDGPVRGWALLVPPGLSNVASAAGPFTAVLLDPGTVRGERSTRVQDLGRARARKLDDLVSAPQEQELLDLLLDPLGLVLAPDERRVASAVRRLTPDATPQDLACDLGVSPSQMRRLLGQQLGTTFSELRRWTLLRSAVLDMAHHPIAGAAARAGFADQPHLTRTSTAMVGRTPGSLLVGRRRGGARSGQKTELGRQERPIESVLGLVTDCWRPAPAPAYKIGLVTDC